MRVVDRLRWRIDGQEEIAHEEKPGHDSPGNLATVRSTQPNTYGSLAVNCGPLPVACFVSRRPEYTLQPTSRPFLRGRIAGNAAGAGRVRPGAIGKETWRRLAPSDDRRCGSDRPRCSNLFALNAALHRHEPSIPTYPGWPNSAFLARSSHEEIAIVLNKGESTVRRDCMFTYDSGGTRSE